MRPARQLCGVALAAEAVFDRWSLLVVRDLLTGPKRFSDLKRLLAPIVPALLTAKLRELEVRGLVEPTVDVVTRGGVYRLTPLGAALRPVVYEAIRWSRGLFGGIDSTALRGEPTWLLLSVPALLTTRPTLLPDLAFGIEADGVALSVTCHRSQTVEAVLGAGGPGVLVATYPLLLAFFAGAPLSPEQRAGLVWRGQPQAWEQLQDLVEVQTQGLPIPS